MLLIALAAVLIFRRKDLAESDQQLNRSASALSGRSEAPTEKQNLVKLFGAFKVLNKAAEDITHEFTPKVKSLSLVILLHSTKTRNGITTEELTDIVWPEQDAKMPRIAGE